MVIMLHILLHLEHLQMDQAVGASPGAMVGPGSAGGPEQAAKLATGSGLVGPTLVTNSAERSFIRLLERLEVWAGEPRGPPA